MNEWMMHLYNALLCIAVHPKRFTIMWGGVVSPQPPPVCSIHLDDVTAPTWQRHQCAHHTPATGGEERESHRANQVCAHTTHQLQVERRERHRSYQGDGDYWEVMIDKGQWWEIGQDTGVTPLLFTRSAMGFLMTTESQDLSLTSHPKYGACWQYSVPVTILGR